jgi:fumarylacetoacetase
MPLDETHDADAKSWIESANQPGTDFPIQNLPLGIFKRKGATEAPRGGVAIGDQILDLAALEVRTGPTLNGLAAQGRAAMRKLRREIFRALSAKSTARKRLERHLVPMDRAELFLPLVIGDYSDFFTGIHHASNMGKMLRPDNPLLPNYKWVPIGYHGRGSSIVISGTPIRRPSGQLKPPDAPAPVYGPSKRLDYEVEMAFIVGKSNRLGEPIPIGRTHEHLFGALLLNDWSARDVQAWEYQPLGPFLAKSFATTISPWVVTMDALEPYRCPAYARAEGDPKPLAYLHDDADQREGGYAIDLEMHLRTAKMQSPARLSRSSFRDSYWTVAQMLAHQTSNGCNVQPGDLLGTGTISGTTPDSFGSMMELTQAGKQPLELPSGEKRSFLEDGDEVIERARCERQGAASIGFGEARGVVRPA